MIDQPDQRRRLTLSQLEVFAATARAGTTRGAAERIARSQSAASAALAGLESALGRRLFDRVGRRLVLNDAGRELLPRAVELLEQAAELERGGEDASLCTPLRLAASFTIGEYVLPSLVAAWTEAHPGGATQLSIANSRDVVAAVTRFDADVGFIEGRQRHPDVVVRHWLRDELVIVAPPSHPLAGKLATTRALADAAWVLREPGSGTREATDDWLLERLGTIRIAAELGSSEAVKRVVAQSTALACLSRRAVAEALQQGRLLEVRTRLPRAARSFSMVVHRRRALGSVAQRFLDRCVAYAETGASRADTARRIGTEAGTRRRARKRDLAHGPA